MAVAHRITEKEYLELALNEPDRLWELWDGVPVEKPWVSMRHNAVAFLLGHFLQSQLDWNDYRITVNGDRTRISSRAYYIPDLVVIPEAYQAVFEPEGESIGVYREPLPLVVEVWSRTTGHYDVAVKLRSYQERGDIEIWYIHPNNRTLTVWRKQPDGSYAESVHRGGIVSIASLPGVTIDLNKLLNI
jgi:Uma2 family endonuclease